MNLFNSTKQQHTYLLKLFSVFIIVLQVTACMDNLQEPTPSSQKAEQSSQEEEQRNLPISSTQYTLTQHIPGHNKGGKELSIHHEGLGELVVFPRDILVSVLTKLPWESVKNLRLVSRSFCLQLNEPQVAGKLAPQLRLALNFDKIDQQVLRAKDFNERLFSKLYSTVKNPVNYKFSGIDGDQGIFTLLPNVKELCFLRFSNRIDPFQDNSDCIKYFGGVRHVRLEILGRASDLPTDSKGEADELSEDEVNKLHVESIIPFLAKLQSLKLVTGPLQIETVKELTEALTGNSLQKLSVGSSKHYQVSPIKQFKFKGLNPFVHVSYGNTSLPGPAYNFQGLGLRDNYTHIPDIIPPEGMQLLASALSTHTSLRKIRLSNNKLSTEGVRVLIEALEKNANLQELSLRDNLIDKGGVGLVAKFLQKTSLQEFNLDLSNSGINAKGVALIIDALANNKNLQKLTLDLSGNYIGSRGLSPIATFLERNIGPALNLDLSDNRIDTEGVSLITKALASNITLRELNLDCNQIDANGAGLIAQALASNTDLRKLSILFNKIEDQGVKSFVLSLQSNTSLQKLILGYDPTIGEEGMKCWQEANNSRIYMYKPIDIGELGQLATLETLAQSSQPALLEIAGKFLALGALGQQAASLSDSSIAEWALRKLKKLKKFKKFKKF